MKKRSGRGLVRLNVANTDESALVIANRVRPGIGTLMRGLVTAATRIASHVTGSGTATVMSAIIETVAIAMNAIVETGTVTDVTTGIVTATGSGDGAAALGPVNDTMTSVASASCACQARSDVR